MDDSLFVDDFDSLNHLNGDVEHCLQVKFAVTFLEQVLERLSELVHNHNMVHFAALCLLVTNEMEVWHCSFASQLVDQLRLPE